MLNVKPSFGLDRGLDKTKGEAADEARDVYPVFPPFVHHFVGEQGEVCEGGVEDLGGDGGRREGREGRVSKEGT